MKILCQGVEIPTGDITLRSSIFEYTESLTFSVPSAIPAAEFTLQVGDVETPFVPVAVDRDDTAAVTYTCYPKAYWDFLCKVSQPLCIDGDLPALLDAVALCEYSVLHATPRAHWVLPSLRAKTLMDLLTKQIVAIDGGCPYVYFCSGGTLVWGDLLTEALGEPKGLFTGNLVKDKSQNTFMSAVPGTVHFTFFDEDSYTRQDAIFLDGAPEANLFRYVADVDERRAAISEVQANFWRRKVGASLVKFDKVVTSGLVPGMKALDMNTENPFLVVSVETVMGRDAGFECSVEVVPSIIPEQQLP